MRLTDKKDTVKGKLNFLLGTTKEPDLTALVLMSLQNRHSAIL